jgi:hypothetical protein
MLHGMLAQIVTWVPGHSAAIPGELAFEGDEASLRLKSNQPGCGTVGDDMTGDPLTGSASARDERWIGVGMVSVERAVLRPRPGASGHRAPYIIRCDPVVILERGPGRLRVTFLVGETAVTCWLRQSDLAPRDPPAL